MKRKLDYWIKRNTKFVQPTAEERRKVESVAESLRQACRHATLSVNPKVEVVLGGSFAHDTWLPGHGDVDAYLVFPKEAGKEGLESFGLEAAKKALRGKKIITRYAEHPYLESFWDGIRVNVVPCLDSEVGAWVSAADRSPYHTKYLNQHLDPKRRLHVRFLKQLLRVNELYGAEIKVRGFSGYVCEVLIVKYGSLQQLADNASEWTGNTLVSVEQLPQKEEDEGGFEIKDPVDPSRNLARAISTQKLAEFVLLMRLLRGGSACDPFRERLFLPARPKGSSLQCSMALCFRHEEKTEDTLWGELLKSGERLAEHLEEDGFEVLNWSAEADEERAAIGLLFRGSIGFRVQQRTGPHFSFAKGTSEFLNNSRTIGWWFDRTGRSIRIEPSKISSVEDAVGTYMRDPTFRAGFARGLAEGAKKSWKLLRGDRVMKSGDSVAKAAISKLFGYEARLDPCD